MHKIEFFSTILESYLPEAACQYIIDPSALPDRKTPFNLLGLSRLHDKHVVGVYPSEEPCRLAVNFPIFVLNYLIPVNKLKTLTVPSLQPSNC